MPARARGMPLRRRLRPGEFRNRLAHAACGARRDWGGPREESVHAKLRRERPEVEFCLCLRAGLARCAWLSGRRTGPCRWRRLHARPGHRPPARRASDWPRSPTAAEAGQARQETRDPRKSLPAARTAQRQSRAGQGADDVCRSLRARKAIARRGAGRDRRYADRRKPGNRRSRRC